MRVVVTGGGGFLGTLVCDVLLDGSREVVALDRFISGRRTVQHLSGRAGFSVESADIADAAVVGRILAGSDVVVHLAGYSDDASCAGDPVGAASVNVSATAALAAAAVELGAARFILASSCAAYAGTNGQEVDEDSTVAPLSLYAEQKLEAERDVLALTASTSTTAIVARLASLWGVSPKMRFDLVVNRMVRDAVVDGVVTIHGTGSQWRPILHVRDAARFIARLAIAPGGECGGSVVNVGATDGNVQIATLARRVAAALRVRPEVRLLLGEDRRSYRVCFDRAARLELGPGVNFVEGVREVEALVRNGSVGDGRQRRFTALIEAEMPAFAGGSPVRSERLPFARPSLGDEEIEAATAVMRSGWMTSGTEARAFEAELAKITGASHVVATTSCTAALHVALAALGIGPGDDVVTSPITFPATANVITQLGATPVFADVDPATLNLDPASLARCLGPATRAVVPVHMAGHPCDLSAIWSIAAEHGIAVVEDAAHAIGATWNGTPIGGDARSAAVCFSFYPTKNMTTIEGGAVALHEDGLAQRIRRLCTHGIDADALSRESRTEGQWSHWTTIEPGFKYALPDVQAAIGRVQLGRLPQLLLRRRCIATAYREAFADLPELTCPADNGPALSAWHLFVVLVHPSALGLDRDEFLLALRDEGIGAGVHFRSLTQQPAYALRADEQDRTPLATDVGDRLLSLPLYPAMTDHDVADVVTAVRRIVLHQRRRRLQSA